MHVNKTFFQITFFIKPSGFYEDPDISDRSVTGENVQYTYSMHKRGGITYGRHLEPQHYRFAEMDGEYFSTAHKGVPQVRVLVKIKNFKVK